MKVSEEEIGKEAEELKGYLRGEMEKFEQLEKEANEVRERGDNKTGVSVGVAVRSGV